MATTSSTDTTPATPWGRKYGEAYRAAFARLYAQDYYRLAPDRGLEASYIANTAIACGAEFLGVCQGYIVIRGGRVDDMELFGRQFRPCKPNGLLRRLARQEAYRIVDGE